MTERRGGAGTGYRNGEPVRYRTPWEIMDGAGALYSTAGDLLKYTAALIEPAETHVERAEQLAAEARVLIIRSRRDVAQKIEAAAPLP